MMKTEATVSQPAAPAGSPLMQVSGALIGIIALILAAAWVIKRMGFAPKEIACGDSRCQPAPRLVRANAW